MTFAGLSGERRTGAVRLEGAPRRSNVVRCSVSSCRHWVYSLAVRLIWALCPRLFCRLPDASDGTGIVHELSTALRQMQMERNKSDLEGQEGGASYLVGRNLIEYFHWL